MLETGKICYQCGTKQLKKFFDQPYAVCCFCEQENADDKLREQGIFQLRYERNDKSIKKCKCGVYFIWKPNPMQQGSGYKKCNLCRIKNNLKSKEKKSATEEKTTGKGSVIEMTPSTGKGKRPENEKIITPKKEENTTKKIMTKKKSENENLITSERTGIESMNTKETTTTKTDTNNYPASLSEENNVTQPLASRPLLDNLKGESLTSMQLLKDSTHKLIGYADKLSRPMMDSEQQIVVRESPAENTKEAVKCLEAARNMMKTRLEFMRFGRELAKDIKNSQR